MDDLGREVGGVGQIGQKDQNQGTHVSLVPRGTWDEAGGGEIQTTKPKPRVESGSWLQVALYVD
jgi:hypothetical protein